MWLRWQWRVFYDKNEIINFSCDRSDDVKYQIPIHSVSWQMGAHQCFCVSKLFYKINRQIIQIQVNCLTIWFLFIFFNFFFWHIKGASVCTFIKTFLWCLVKVWRYTRLQTLKSIWVTTTHKFYLSSVSPKFLWVFVSQNKICIFVVYSHGKNDTVSCFSLYLISDSFLVCRPELLLRLHWIQSHQISSSIHPEMVQKCFVTQ